MKEWLDKEAIENLRALDEPGEPPFFEKLSTLFIEEGILLLGEINRAIESRDSELVGYLTHKLKGMSINVGAKAVFEILEKVESAAKRGDRAFYHSAWPALLEAFNATLTELEKILRAA
jgi:HPt (histidine-containing phosphotransfer) domain-containing protein